MNLSGHYFLYGGQSSEHYGLRVLNLDTDRLKKLSSDISYKTSYSRGLKKFRFNGIDYSDSPAEFEIEFLSEEPIDEVSARKITQWLFNKAKPQKLLSDPRYDDTRMSVNGVVKREYLNCVFYNPEEVRAANGLRGWKATCLTDGVMATQEEVEITKTDFSALFDIKVDSNIDDYVYPQMTIVTGAGSTAGNITIINASDSNRQFQLKAVKPATTIYVDNEVGTVAYDTGKSLYGNLEAKRFFRLVPGKNTITVSGNVSSLKIKFSNARWLV